MPFIVTFKMRNGSKAYLKDDVSLWTFEREKAGEWCSNEAAIKARQTSRAYFPRKTAWDKTMVEVVK